MRRYGSLALLLTAFALPDRVAFALDPGSPPAQYSHTVWRTSDGLPDNFVQALLQTRDGYLWLGTAEGLVRFDGTQFTVFDTQNTPALHHNSVVSLLEQRNGVLWVGTSGGGVALYEKGRFVASYDNSNGLPNNYVRSLFEDRDGAIWITAHGGGLVRYSNGQFASYTRKDGLPSDSLRTVYQGKDGTLWIGTDEDGICAMRERRFACFDKSSGLRSNQIRAFHQDRLGRLWIGTRAGGLHLFDGRRFVPFQGEPGLPNNAVRAIAEDSDGNLWIGTEGGGAFRLRGNAFTAFSTRDGLPHSFVRSIVEDREGNLWLGTRGGLSRLRDKKAVTWTTSEGLVSDNVRAIFEDSRGRMWIGTGTGISLIENGSARTVRLSSEWSRDVIRSFAEARDGSMWIGADTGLYRWKDGLVTKLDGSPAARAQSVRGLLEDRQGRLWAGVPDGLLLMENGAARIFSRRDGLPADGINAIAQDRNGTLWLATEDGLLEHRDGRFRKFTSREGLSHDRVTSLHVDATNALWIGTRGGLTRFRDGSFATFRRRDGLNSDNLLQVVEDRTGHLWLTSRRGVSRISKRELEDFAAGRIRELRPVSFDTSDGMKSQECNGEAQPAGILARNGHLWFPTVQGVVVFNPLNIRTNPVPPSVVIERVVSGSRSWPAAGGSISLSADSGDLEFQFTAISLSAPERVRFRYRLDGYDAGWIETGRRRSAWYTNLPPNKYKFRVLAYANDGSWPREESSLELNLQPRFYQTAWFYVVCGAFALGLVALVYRIRVVGIHRRYEAVLEERARIGREIHDTLMQGVTGVALQLEVASQRVLQSPGVAKAQLDRALTRLDEVVADARRTVLDLRATQPAEGDMEIPLRKLASELAEERGIQVTVSVEGPPRPLPETTRVHLLRIAREAVTNSVLHSRAAHLRLTLRFQPGEVHLLAADDGCGFDARDQSLAHFGITGMRERAEALGGRLAIRSAPGQGTEISVVAPVAGGA
jgi:ligand-binding sensor domain-containing protein/signal transduction histidine kinase